MTPHCFHDKVYSLKSSSQGPVYSDLCLLFQSHLDSLSLSLSLSLALPSSPFSSFSYHLSLPALDFLSVWITFILEKTPAPTFKKYF
jgi:hypothetical protein